MIELSSTRLKTFIQEYNIALMFVIFLFACIIITGGKWLSPGNISNVLSRSSILGILTMGQCIVLISGQIDLSIASLLALFCGIYANVFLAGYGILPALAVASAVILLIGVFNGIVASRTTIPAFVITLGTMMVARSTYYYILGAAKYIPQIQKIVYSVVYIFPKGQELFPAFIWASVFVVFFYVLNFTINGKHLYAVGGSERSALVTGVSISRIKMSAFIFSSILVIVAAFVFIYRVGNLAPNTGEEFLLDSVAAPIIGGVSIFGGRGRLWKAMMGALFLEVLTNFMHLIGVDPFIFPAVKGVLIAIGVVISILATPPLLRVVKT